MWLRSRFMQIHLRKSDSQDQVCSWQLFPYTIIFSTKTSQSDYGNGINAEPKLRMTVQYIQTFSS